MAVAGHTYIEPIKVDSSGCEPADFNSISGKAYFCPHSEHCTLAKTACYLSEENDPQFWNCQSLRSIWRNENNQLRIVNQDLGSGDDSSRMESNHIECMEVAQITGLVYEAFDIDLGRYAASFWQTFRRELIDREGELRYLLGPDNDFSGIMPEMIDKVTQLLNQLHDRSIYEDARLMGLEEMQPNEVMTTVREVMITND